MTAVTKRQAFRNFGSFHCAGEDGNFSRVVAAAEMAHQVEE